jgi:UDP-N-acetylmuramate: L-alanyl-gamma-D-glutamyl-meso-diaminopimelate ligase
MHNLAMALDDAGHQVSGSDDEIFEPSRSRLLARGILPDAIGWFPEKITRNLDMVILGMHARGDNPELQRAHDLGIRVVSYPEFLFEVYKNKTRVVIAGSHGKTTITSMIMHVLQHAGREFDYMVGAQLEGFDCMVRISDAPLAIIEGDEYLSSPIDRRSKFLWYQPQVAIISGIAWDHINVFPTFKEYVDQFHAFANTIPDNGQLVWFSGDAELSEVAKSQQHRLKTEAYHTFPHRIANGKTVLMHDGLEWPIEVFGDHNLQNISGAMLLCNALGIGNDVFLRAISGFRGASKRLELLSEKGNSCIYRDFAHAPSKLKATVKAVHEQFPQRKLVACMELHTFSSLNKAFLSEYQGAMNGPEHAIVYFNPAVIAHKKLESISVDDVKLAFGRHDLEVITSSDELQKRLRSFPLEETNLLLMSSGNFDGMDVVQFAKNLHQE